MQPSYFIPPARQDHLYYPANQGWSLWEQNELDVSLRAMQTGRFTCQELEALWLSACE